MAASDFEIGATAGTRSPVIDLIDRQPSDGQFIRFPVQHFKSTGQQYGDGLPVVRWHWKALTQADLNTLHDFCKNGADYVPSATVSIQTRDDTGAFVAFATTIMHWPQNIDAKRVQPDIFRDVMIEFTDCTT